MRFKKCLAGVVSAAIVVQMLSITSFAYDEVYIDGLTFPDYTFCSYVYDNFDIDGDGYLSGDELNVTEIDLDGLSCETLEGIEVFENLEQLSCLYNKLTSLDVSQLKNLKVLECAGNKIGSLDVSNNVKLNCLDCSDTGISSLDVSLLPDLKTLSCSSNQLKELDLSNNTLLEDLQCYENQIQELDLSNNPNLIQFVCSDNQLSALDVSDKVNLETFFCSNNNISVLDVSKNTELINLSCYGNKLKSLDVSNCSHLSSLYCYDNQLETLNVQNTKLHSLNCSNNKLTELDISTIQDLRDHFMEYYGIGFKYCIDDKRFFWDEDICRVFAFSEDLPFAVWEDVKVADDGTKYYYNVGSIVLRIKYQLKESYSCKIYRDGELVYEYEAPKSDYCAMLRNIDDKTSEGLYLRSGMYTIDIYDRTGKIWLYSDTVKVINEVIVNTSTPTAEPTPIPTVVPTISPTVEPTLMPTAEPTTKPTTKPVATVTPTQSPTVEDFAERLYTTCLGRPAEKAGMEYWASELKGGMPGSEVAEGFFFSQEYIDKNLSNKEFIGTLYETFMGRNPADAEVDYWATEMKAGKTRKNIFDGFVNSPEWADICLTYGIRSGGLATPTFEKKASAEVKAFAERLYTTCLGRAAEKDGLDWWAAELANLRQTGTVAAQGFFFSPEFIGLKTDDEEYVTRLYRTFMGREPETAGFDFWVGELKSGKDRKYVFDGFSVAPEFANLCADAGILS